MISIDIFMGKEFEAFGAIIVPTMSKVELQPKIDIFSDSRKDAYLSCAEQDEITASLDPLKLDSFFLNDLPRLNNEGNVSELVAAAKELVPTYHNLQELNEEESRAAVRDIGFIVASLARHGITISSVPQAEAALLALSERTAEVPRDTVFSYGPRNPAGARMRLFTGTEEERFFVESFRRGMQFLPQCIKSLDTAYSLSIYNKNYSQSILEAKYFFQGIVDSVVEVKKIISPETFTYQLRPYFPVLTIGSRDYHAPGGAQMPIFVIDTALWGTAKKNEATFSHYFWDNFQYLPPEYRGHAEEVFNRPSLVEKAIEESIQVYPLGNELAVRSLCALEEFLKTIQKFRFPHKRLAEENMKIRSQGSVGSGGYSTEILDYLLEGITNSTTQVASTRIGVLKNL